MAIIKIVVIYWFDRGNVYLGQKYIVVKFTCFDEIYNRLFITILFTIILNKNPYIIICSYN